MRILVESLKRLYNAEKVPEVVLKSMLKKKQITQEEYAYIVAKGEEGNE